MRRRLYSILLSSVAVLPNQTLVLGPDVPLRTSCNLPASYLYPFQSSSKSRPTQFCCWFFWLLSRHPNFPGYARDVTRISIHIIIISPEADIIIAVHTLNLQIHAMNVFSSSSTSHHYCLPTNQAPRTGVTRLPSYHSEDFRFFGFSFLSVGPTCNSEYGNYFKMSWCIRYLKVLKNVQNCALFGSERDNVLYRGIPISRTPNSSTYLILSQLL